MPNWFYFTVHVSGEKKDVEQFVENVKGSEKYQTESMEFDFNHFVPQPDNIFRGNLGREEKKMCEEQGIPNWYRWNSDNWGTKWNANVETAFCLSSVDGFPMEYEYEISTAWAFPVPVMDRMVEMYPNIDFTIVGEEESGAYGVYWSTSEDIFLEEEPILVDESDHEREVYFNNNDEEYLWRYRDNGELVPEQDNFYPFNKYSWS